MNICTWISIHIYIINEKKKKNKIRFEWNIINERYVYVKLVISSIVDIVFSDLQEKVRYTENM